MPLMFGKTPALPDAVKLKFSTYFDAAELPKPPPVYGVANHSLVNTWPMFGNTTYGDCVWAGADSRNHAVGAGGRRQGLVHG